MVTRFCPNCGTQVDETAAFCPTCGQAIDEADEMAMPPAPAWPEPEPRRIPAPEPTQTRTIPAAEPEPAPAAASPSTRTGTSAQAPDRAQQAEVKVPLTPPLTLSGWLIGGGAALGALGALVGLFDGFVSPMEVLLLVVLLAVAVSVFLATSIPAIPNLRLVTLVVVLVAFGAALDRLTLGSGIGSLLLFVGAAAAAIGAVIVELDQDQQIGGA